MMALRWLWQSAHFWTIWAVAGVSLFMAREFIAIGTRRYPDTLSDNVWKLLNVLPGQTIAEWNAVRFLVFGAWLTLTIWLTFHFFFREFT